MPVALLPTRRVLEISGADRVPFLQGLVSADVTQAGGGRALWAALLTPQGKWLTDFFLFATPDVLLLDVEAGIAAELLQRLTRFRLRSKVVLRETDFAVYAGWGSAPQPEDEAENLLAAPDPRLALAGWRALATELPTDATAQDWDRHRLPLGLPDGSRDLVREQTVLLEAGFDELGGISWTKGCWMGQELTARTRYRGLLKRRLVPVELDGPLPEPGTPIQDAEGNEVGEIRSGHEGMAMAQLRLAALDGRALQAAGTRLAARIPDWVKLPEPTTPAKS